MTVKDHELHISSARDIFEALHHSDAGVRLAMIQAAAEHPDRILKYGTYDGRDIIDELLRILRASPVSSERAMYLGALTSYDDPRVVEAVLDELHETRDAEVVLLCTRRLAKEPGGLLSEAMKDYLFRDDLEAHARAAANVLAGQGGLDDRQRLRTAMLADADSLDPPGPDDASHDLWREALDGPYARRARLLAESLGLDAFRFLAAKWDDAPEEEREWLLEWGGREGYEAVLEPANRALKGGSERLVPAALKCMAALPPDAPAGADWPKGLMRSPNAEVRRLFAAVYPGAFDWRAALAEERAPGVRIALMERLALEECEAFADDLFAALDDSDWRIRAAAAQCLAQIGGGLVIERAKELLGSEARAAGVAAARILLDLGQEEWLEENILL